eukprot:CAMPEP_0197450630 /NCGR_PEP_ID=MMETSP1175-20131217/25959_1 /TAXON_ID=1003142 /ORGANISM="Triceratium dubium, Strain CCMP147" /LENGTH=134 /DNA_ID=CAMNT_0042983093 /DNA_START=63 /DNA_END=467 /DNA_ORIENTATION=-
MKVSAALSLCALTLTASASAFVPTTDPTISRLTTQRFAFWDKAFHGGGSAKQEDLDEQWEAQQAILAARRGKHGHNKEHLHQKYEGGGPKHFQLTGSKPMLHDNPALDTPGPHVVLEDLKQGKQTKKFKFFWEK